MELKNLLEIYTELSQKQNGKAPDVKIRKIGELYTVSYIHGGANFENDYIRCSGGLTFDKDDNIYLRGYEKFFNYLQLETRENVSEDFKEQYSRIQESEYIRVREKMDGTLILVGEYQGELLVGTKSSIDNEYTRLVKPLVKEKLPNIEKYLKGYTLTMEYVAPDNRIGVTYDKEDLILLHVVKNKTGQLYEGEFLQEIVHYPEPYPLTLPKTTGYSLKELLELQKTKKNFEGWVVINNYGNLIKFKTEDWYKEKGKYELIFFPRKVTQNVVGQIYDAYVNDGLDDLVAYKNQFHSGAKYVDKVIETMYHMIDHIDKLIEKYGTDYRNMAQEYMGNIAINIHKYGYNDRVHQSIKKYLVEQVKKEIEDA